MNEKPEPVIIEDEETALAITDELDNVQLDAEVGGDALAMLDPEKAAQLVAGVRPDTLVYIVKLSGQKPIVGLSAAGAQILAARLGGFETLPEGAGSTLTETTMVADVRRIEGEKVEVVAEDLPGIRASVQVRYTTPSGKSTSFVGVDEEARFIILRTYVDKHTGKPTGGGVKADPKAAVKAWNKAERNAIRKFFAPAEKLLAQFAAHAQERGQVLMVGDEEPIEEYRKAANDVMAHRDARRRETLAKEPKWTDAQVASFRALMKRRDIPPFALDRQLGIFGVLKPESLPASALVAMKKWADTYVAANGAEPPQPPVVAVATPTKPEEDPALDAKLQEVGRACGYPEAGVLQLIADKTDGSFYQKECLLAELTDRQAEAQKVAAENREPGEEQQLAMD